MCQDRFYRLCQLCQKKEKMEKLNLEKFAKTYIETWSTKDANDRKQLVEKMYSSSAKFYANEPGDPAVELHGTDAILGNISQVTERLVIGNGLITELVDFLKNHNTLRVSWQMKTPTGELALKGMNFLQLDDSDKIERDYIFIGIKH